MYYIVLIGSYSGGVGRVMSKNENMLFILWMLNSGRKITAKEISEKLEINIRTVYRYIDSLCASGVPIISDSGHNGGYTLLNNFIKSPLIFDLEEQKALFHAAMFAQETGYPFDEVLRRVMRKIKMYSNGEQAEKLDRHLIGFDVINCSYDSSLKLLLEEIEEAIALHHSLCIEYHTSHEESSKNRQIDPYGIIYWNSKWYLIAYCHLRNEMRSFRVDRIRKMSINGYEFQRLKDFSPREFFLKSALFSSECKEGYISVKIKGKSYAIDELCSHWLLRYHMVERSSDEVFFMMDKNLVFLNVPYLLLPYGKSIEIIEPENLKKRLAEISIELAQHYGIDNLTDSRCQGDQSII